MTAATQDQLNATVISPEKKSVQIRSLLGKPTVLVFFPAAFTNVCTAELCNFRDSMSRFNAIQAQVFGLSIDTPFTLKVFAEQNQLNFTLLSDANREATRAFEVVWPDISGVRDVSNRAVFVLDSASNVVYEWVAPHLGVEPPYDLVLAAVEQAS